MPGQIRTPTAVLLPAILLAALLHGASARAEVRIAGAADAIQVEARDAPLEEVLSALRANFGLRYRSGATLDRRVSGIYEGPLQRVVSRLLEGYDFVLKSEAGVVEVLVVGGGQTGQARPSPVPAPSPVPPTPRRRGHQKNPG